ncbi:MAG: elongation factor G [Chitinophagales bacterium]|nr:elongation factor G [Chitinophagales bacterium]MDW8428387.1 elongation factor G [Chitinophagales bacterium]
MKIYDDKHIKNVVLLGASKSGKTTLVETMMFEAGLLTRRGTVEEGNTVSDYHELERERGNSVYASLMHVEWKDCKINLIDTPGLDDFIGEVVSSLRVADTALMVLNAQHGVEVGTELIWNYCDQFRKPVLFAINQLDHEKSNFELTVEQARKRFGKAFTLMQYPIGEGPQFTGIIDLLKMTYYRFPPQGGKPEKLPVPDHERNRAEELHNQLVEVAAENDEKLMELYFEKGTLDEDEMREGLRLGMIRQQVFPAFCLSAKSNMGAGRLLGFIANVLPSPCELMPEETIDGQPLPCDPQGPAVTFIFKTLIEPHLGSLSLFKVLRGEITAGMELINAQNETVERINQLFILAGKNRQPINRLLTGDLGATLKLKNTLTNHTLHAKGHPITVKPTVFPSPRISVAVVAKSKSDEEKLSTVLADVQKEDPSLVVEYNREVKQLLLHAQGELHLNAIKWRLEHVFKLHVDFERMKIPYRETIRKSAQATYRHKKQTGGAGQFAEVAMMIEPYREGYQVPAEFTLRGKEEIDLEWGGKLIYHNCIVGGAIDARFMPSILKGIMEKMQEGPTTGSYVRDICVYVYDGKMHPVDSNDTAFKIAGAMAFRECFRQADPKLLEPVYDLEILVPEEQLGDVMGDLNTRRATILGMDAQSNYSVIRARVPLAELDKYSNTLRSLTQGKASFKMKFAEYQLVPPEIQKKLAEEYQKSLKEEAA